MLTWPLLLGLVVLLALAALIDLRQRRIPNWLTGSVAALYPIYVLASTSPLAWPAALAAASAVFLLGLVLFARQLVGGGDVKLIAAMTLWAGFDHLVLFALVTSLAGGGLALGSLWYQRWHGVIGAQMAAFGWNPAPAGRTHHDSTATSEGSDAIASEGIDAIASSPIDRRPLTLPYGVAIAAGGLAVIAQLTKL